MYSNSQPKKNTNNLLSGFSFWVASNKKHQLSPQTKETRTQKKLITLDEKRKIRDMKNVK